MRREAYSEPAEARATLPLIQSTGKSCGLKGEIFSGNSAPRYLCVTDCDYDTILYRVSRKGFPAYASTGTKVLLLTMPWRSNPWRCRIWNAESNIAACSSARDRTNNTRALPTLVPQTTLRSTRDRAQEMGALCGPWGALHVRTGKDWAGSEKRPGSGGCCCNWHLCQQGLEGARVLLLVPKIHLSKKLKTWPAKIIATEPGHK